MKPLKLAAFIEKAEGVHPEKYVYIGLFRSEGCRLKVQVVCPKHGAFTSTPAHIYAGSGCKVCGIEQRAEKMSDTFDQVVEKSRAIFGDKYTYLKLDRLSGRPSVRFVCREHGEVHKTLNKHLSAKQGCNSCGANASADSRRYALDDYTAKARDLHNNQYQDYTLEVSENLTYVRYTCGLHGNIRQLAANHLIGQGCQQCGYTSTKLAHRQTWEDFVAKASAVHNNLYRYTSLSYEPTKVGARERTFVNYVCAKHGEHKQDSSCHLLGQGCPKCTNRVSKPSIEVYDFLKSLNLDVSQEHRFPDSRKHIDLIIPEQKLAIEYNGNYWHTSEYLASNYHNEKSKLAKANGYRMIHIWSHEWEHKRTIVENLLKSATNKASNRIFARETTLTEVSLSEAREFLHNHHIQGPPTQGKYLALKAAELVAVMCFNSNTSARGQVQDPSHVELTRYATSSTVVGGFSKLLKAFLAQNQEVKTVASYSDNRMFTGDMYSKAGFVKVHETGPNYRYLEGGVPRHKSNYQKSKLINRFGEEFCKGKTEREITEQNQIYRIYDCGLTKWAYSVNPTQL